MTPPVQRFLKNKVVAYLENKLDTEVNIGSIYIGLPKKVIIKDLYLEDRHKDTLASVGNLEVDIALTKLIFKNEIRINTIYLSNSTLKVKRQLPDTSFNFQFIVDAFGGTDTTTVTDTTAQVISINKISLDNIRCVYKDVVTGNDAVVQFAHFSTRLGKIAPEKMQFEIPETRLVGLVADIVQTKPLTKPETLAEDKIEASEPSPLALDFESIDLEDIRLNYRNDASATYAQVAFEGLEITMNDLDLQHRTIAIDRLLLNNSNIAFRLGKKQAAEVVAKEAAKEIETRADAGWRFLADEITIDNNFLRFDNDNDPPLKYGMDYSHLKADDLDLSIENFIFSDDSTGGTIKSASFKEKSGFVLNELQADFLYSGTRAYLKNLYIETPGTVLKRKAAIAYSSIESIIDNPGMLYVDADISNSRIRVKDILTFVPALRSTPAFSNANATLFINGRFRGRLDAFKLDILQVRGLSETSIDLDGSIIGLYSGRNLAANLNIRNFTTSKKDISTFIPANYLPTNLTLPERINLNGTIVTKNDVTTGNLRLNSSMGILTVKGDLAEWNNPDRMRYNATLTATELDVGSFLQNAQIPDDIAASFTVHGTGTNPKTMDALIDGKIESVIFQQYNYRDISVNASLKQQLLNANIRINDPNIDVTAEGKANISNTNGAFTATVMVDSIKFQPLGITKSEMLYRGKLEADFPVANLSRPEGNLLVSQSLLVHKEKRVELETIQLQAGNNDSGHYVKVSSALANASLYGQYDLIELPDVFMQSIQPYFKMEEGIVKHVKPYDFNIAVMVHNTRAWNIIVPELDKMQPAQMQAHFSNVTGISGWANVPLVETNLERLTGLQAKLETRNDSLVVDMDFKHFYLNQNLQIGTTSLQAQAANNNIHFFLKSQDTRNKDKYSLGGNFQYIGPNQYALSLSPDNLMLNYDQWTMSPENKITVNNNDILVNNFLLSRNNQQLKIQSLTNQSNSPMQINFTNFRLATITGLIQADSTLADGMINGNITLEQLNPKPIFTSDITINDLRVMNDTTGNLRLQVDNRNNDVFDVNATLSGHGNDAQLSGTYQPYATTNNLDLKLNVQKLSVSTLEAFSAGTIYNGSGSITGNFTLRGNIAKPVINGELNFDKAMFGYLNLNDHLVIDKEKLVINNEGILLDNFIIKDSAGQELRMDGKIATTDFMHYKFDARLRANNFRLINTTKKENKDMYGKLYVTANLHLTGDETLPVIDGRISVNKGTNMTMVLPQEEPEIVRREGIVEFVSFSSPNDSLFLVDDTIHTKIFSGADVSVTIETSKEADFTLVIDEGNGDFIHIKGTTLLTAETDRSNNVTLSGTFELESGTYELTFNLLRRKFEIEKGSRITWEGEPLDGTIDIKAKYIAKVSPIDLVKNQLGESTTSQRNTYMQRLPFEVILHMEGSLEEPVFKFDIQLPEDKGLGVSQDVINTVQTRLDQLRLDEAEMNRQVFSILLLNRFVGDNPLEGMDNSFDPSMMAKQSVSRLMSDQLNRLASNLISGVNLNFDIETYEDYTTGQKQNHTDLNVELSKQLLNDRLTVTVGSNFAIEGTSSNTGNNFAGDVALDYKLSRDGRYMLRAYRLNEYYGAIEGYVIETGVGFVMTIDYNRFREIFETSKKKEERRRQRQAQSAQQNANQQ